MREYELRRAAVPHGAAGATGRTPNGPHDANHDAGSRTAADDDAAGPGIAQIRVFCGGSNGAVDHVGLVESAQPIARNSFDPATLGPGGSPPDLVNLYVPYARGTA